MTLPANLDATMEMIEPFVSGLMDGLAGLGLSTEAITNALLGIAVGQAISEEWSKERVVVAVAEGYDDISKAAAIIETTQSFNAPGSCPLEQPS